MSEPIISTNPLYMLLRTGEIDQFNARRAAGEAYDLRGLDLRRLEARGLDLRDCYLRQADLRGIDLRESLLEGASIIGARISGTYFPASLAPEEINLSLLHGTRMRSG
ncbi:MAG: pentapeptide repeat-containing protein [Candidatus Sedimenticola endophacoides]